MNPRPAHDGQVPADRTTRALIAWTRLLAAHRIGLTILLIVLGALFGKISSGIAWQADLLQFFSSDSADVRNMQQAAAQPGLANQMRIDVHFERISSSGVSDGNIIQATHELADALGASGKFRSVWTGIEADKMATAYATLLARAPILLSDADREEIEQRATPEYLNARFGNLKAKLADPDGEFLLQQVRADPLNISDVIASKLRTLSPSGGQSNNGSTPVNTPTITGGVLLTHDVAGAPHAMIVCDPTALPSDQTNAEKTLSITNATLAKWKSAHPELGTWMIGSHRGYVENAQRVMADVSLVSVLGSIAVAVAIALYFRRISTALLCIIPPSIGIGIALGLAGLFHISLPLILLGFAGLLCGSTTDYGIQIIAECRRMTARQGVWHPDIPAISAHRLLGAISMSVATSVTGFAALGLSASPGLRALGLFVAFATLCIWGITFLILPVYLGPWILPKNQPASAKEHKPSPFHLWRRTALFTGAILFIACTCLFTSHALHIRFNSDPRTLDGSSASFLADQEAFARVWGDVRNRAVVFIDQPNAAAALDELNRVDQYLRDQQRDGLISGIISVEPLLPDSSTVKSRAVDWDRWWTPERINALRASLELASRQVGFKPGTFTAYADTITTMPTESADGRLADSPAALFPGFINIASPPQSPPSHITIATIVQMRDDRSPRLTTSWAQELRVRYPDVIVLSGKMLAFDASERSRAEAENLAPWCLLAILVPLWAYFRQLRKAWLTLTCLIIGFLWVLGSAQLFGNGLNLLSLVPILFTLGVAVDYGIYAASDPALQIDSSNTPPDSRLSATFLCASTTILGAGSLIVATHPALRWLGITLVAGISGGYLTSFFIVAPLVRRCRPPAASPKPRRSLRALLPRTLGRLSLQAFLVCLTILLCIPLITQFNLFRQHPPGVTTPLVPMKSVQIAPRTYQAGSSWMRWHEAPGDSGLWEITVAGTPQERGLALGALVFPIDVRIENEMLEQLDYFVPEEWARWLLLRAVATNLITLPSHIPPEYQEEIFAAATPYPDPHAYLAPSYPRILSYHALHDISQMLIDNPLIVPNTFACTGIVSLPSYTSASSAGHLMLGRVFDFEGGESFGRQKSITYVIPAPTPNDPRPNIPFAHVAWPGLAGAVTGINQQKLALFLNAAATEDIRRIGTPTILMARDILQHARTIDEADTIIRSTQVFVSDIIVIADGKTGRAKVFEKSPSRTASYDVDDSAVITNHLITPQFINDPVNKERRDDGSTVQGNARARQLLDRIHHQVTVPNLAALLRDKKGLDDKDIGYGNRNAIDGLIACHAVSMDVTTGELWVAAWPNAEGAFIGVNVLSMLDSAVDHPALEAPASPSIVPPDNIMTNGTWSLIEAGRDAEKAVDAALHISDFKEAEINARRIIQDNPSFYLGHELLGRALFYENDFAGAKAELQKALSLDPPYAQRRTAIEGLISRCDTH